MNLLYVTPYFLSNSQGGIESQVKTFTDSLARSHKCVVVAPAATGDGPEIADGAIVHGTQFVDPLARMAPSYAECLDFFGHVIRSEEIDRIVAHNLHTWVHPNVPAALVAAASERGVPAYLRVHNFLHAQEATLLRQLPWRRILCVSRRLAEQVAGMGVARELVTVLYPPIDTGTFFPHANSYLRQTFSIPEYAPIVLHASRIVGGPAVFQEKGFAQLLGVFSTIECGHLVFCTAQPPASHAAEYERHVTVLRRMAAALALAQRVHITAASFAEMPKVYNGAQVFVMLSSMESFGRVFAEASACGLPVVAADAGGVAEAVKHGESGFLAKSEWQARGYVVRLLGDAKLRATMGQAGIAHVRQHFSSDLITRQLLAVLET